MLVLDVGAHVGYFTLLASRLVGPTGKVCAFEPECHTFDLLRRNVALNNLTNVVLVEKAVTSQAARRQLFLCPQGSDRNSLFDGAGHRQSQNITTLALDEFWVSLSCPTIDLVKVDVEGAEASVVQGMTSLLAKDAVCRMIVELNPLALDKAGADPQQLLQVIRDARFKIYEIDDHGPLRVVEESGFSPLIQRLRQGKESTNLFCVHQGIEVSSNG